MCNSHSQLDIVRFVFDETDKPREQNTWSQPTVRNLHLWSRKWARGQSCTCVIRSGMGELERSPVREEEVYPLRVGMHTGGLMRR